MSRRSAPGGTGAVRRRFGPRRGRQRGAVAIEFALVLPILVALLLGVTTTGLSYSRAIGVTNAVREGARFGATADASASSWADDAARRVLGTEFDFGATSPPATGVCVQLWRKTGASSGVQVAGTCRPGTVTPAPSLPTTATQAPAVPETLPVGACVVRVVAARNFTIHIAVVPAWTRVSAAYAVSRYERSDKVPTCAA